MKVNLIGFFDICTILFAVTSDKFMFFDTLCNRIRNVGQYEIFEEKKTIEIFGMVLSARKCVYMFIKSINNVGNHLTKVKEKNAFILRNLFGCSQNMYELY